MSAAAKKFSRLTLSSWSSEILSLRGYVTYAVARYPNLSQRFRSAYHVHPRG